MMNSVFLLLLSFFVGVLVVLQGSINARLGVLLSNSVLATSIAMVMSAFLTLVAVFATVRQMPSTNRLHVVPLYMWFSGGVLSFLAVSLFYYIIPKVGIATAVTFGLCGQIIFAAIAGHFGWFGMPMEPFTVKKFIGVLIMVSGVIIIKSQ